MSAERAPPHPQDSKEEGSARQSMLDLMLGIVGSCNCDIKTPEINYHAETCRYRLLVEGASDLRQAATALPELLAEIERLTEERDPLTALGEACERNGLAGFKNDGSMWFQPPGDLIAEQTAEPLLRRAQTAEAEIERLRGALEDLLKLVDQEGETFFICDRCGYQHDDIKNHMDLWLRLDSARQALSPTEPLP